MWDTWSPENISLILSFYCAITILGIESTVWFDGWPDNLFGLRVSNSVAGLLLLLTLVNGWLVDRFLAHMTPRDAALPRRLRCLRLLFAIVPVFGIHALTFWKRYLQQPQPKHETLAIPTQSRALDLSEYPGRLAAGARLQQLYRSGLSSLLMAMGIVPLVVWAGWLMSASFGPHRRAVILGSCALLHLIACTLIMHFSGCRLRNSHVTGRQRALYRIVPFLWLLAAPGVLLGLILSFWLVNPPETLSWSLYARRTGTGRMPLWQILQRSLHRQWQSLPWFLKWRQPTEFIGKVREGYAEHQVTAFYRLKTLLLPLEGAAFYVICSLLATHLPSLTYALNVTVRSAAFGVIILGGIGLLLQITMLAAKFLRLEGWAGNLIFHPYGRYLLLSQAAFLAGFEGAVLIRQGQIRQFALLLSLGSVLCAILSIIFFLPKASGSGAMDLLQWIALFFSLIALGLLIGLEGRGSQQSLKVLGWLTALSPLWSCGLFMALGGWLLRPFSWRDAFDRSLPLRLRAALASVVLTAVLPLGGLAIPFWIYARHRLWPRYERGLAADRQR